MMFTLTSKFDRNLLLLPAVVLVAILAMASSVLAQNDNNGSGRDNGSKGNKPPIGTWMVRFEGDETTPTTFSQYSFFADGNAIESDTQIAFDTPVDRLVFSDGVGQWEQTGKNTYIVRYQKMGKPDGNNTLTLFTQSTLAFTYDRQSDSFVGTLAISVYDGDGNFAFSASQGSSAIGQRLPMPKHGEQAKQFATDGISTASSDDK